MFNERSCMRCANLTTFSPAVGHLCIECGVRLSVDEATAKNDCIRWVKDYGRRV